MSLTRARARAQLENLDGLRQVGDQARLERVPRYLRLYRCDPRRPSQRLCQPVGFDPAPDQARVSSMASSSPHPGSLTFFRHFRLVLNVTLLLTAHLTALISLLGL